MTTGKRQLLDRKWELVPMTYVRARKPIAPKKGRSVGIPSNLRSAVPNDHGGEVHRGADSAAPLLVARSALRAEHPFDRSGWRYLDAH